MTTEFYADYIKKTTFDKESHSVKGKFDTPSTDQITEAATDVKKKPASKTPKMEVPATEIPEENLDEKGKGLWANIHAKRARGEKPNPPGHPDRPSAADLKRSQSEELHGDQHKHGAVEEKKSLASLKNSSMLDGKDRIKNMIQKVKKPVEKQEEGILDAVSKVASKAVSGVKNMAAKRTATLTGKKPSYSEETEDSITEATFKVDVDGLPTMYIDGSSAGSIKAQLRKKFKDPESIVSIERITPSEKKKELRAKVSEEQVDEISNASKRSYVRVAARDVAHQGAKAERGVANNDREAIRAADRKRDNRLKGIDRATKGMKNEDTENVDELNRDTLGSYISKASDASKHKGMPTKKVDNRYAGVAKASKKIDKMEEDYSDQKAHLKKVGKGGQVSYTNSGKKMSGEYGGLKNKGGRSYAMVHHKTHSAMVPLPQINHKESVNTNEGIMDAISKVKSTASSIGKSISSNYKKDRNIAAPGKGRNILKGE